MVPLPKTTPEGYKVIVLKIADTDPNKFIHLDSAKAMILFNDIRYSEDGIVPGYIYVTDARGYTWSHVTKINFHILRIYMKYMQVRDTDLLLPGSAANLLQKSFFFFFFGSSFNVSFGFLFLFLTS